LPSEHVWEKDQHQVERTNLERREKLTLNVTTFIVCLALNCCLFYSVLSTLRKKVKKCASRCV